MCEEELPRELDKLEIGPILPQIKLMNNNLPVSLNPFYSEAAEELADVTATDVIFGDVKCSCRIRRRSESVLDDCKSSVSNSGFPRIEHIIKNTTHFKHKNRKKVILREPILKSLQKCMNPKHLKAFAEIPRLTNKGISSGNAEDEFNKSCPTIDALNLDDTISSLRINNERPSTSSGKRGTSGITDFRDLIQECQSLLETNFSFNSWSAAIASRKNVKNFNVIQTAENRSQSLKYCTTNRHQSRVQTDNPNREEGGSRQCGSSSANTSCSQQARINASTVAGRSHSSSVAGSTPPCDVTIDELASYFETFVHIPKKMSSMAEMMYI